MASGGNRSRWWLQKLRRLVGVDEAAVAPVYAPPNEPLVFAPVSYEMSDPLWESLCRARAAMGGRTDRLETGLDAVLLYGGLGPGVALTRDGRVVMDGWYDWTSAPPSARDAHAAIVVGADMLATPALLEILPTRPVAASDCPQCQGACWHKWPGKEHPHKVVCVSCGGMGWTMDDPSLGRETR